MTFLWPWALTSLALVAAAAWWAFHRPMRQLVIVSSLTLWTRALEALGSSAAVKSRRLTGSWVLLLAGAAALAVGLARPVYYARKPARQIAVVICPSAELAGLPGDALAAPIESLLSRLDGQDRVRLVLPSLLGGAAEPLSPQQAIRRVRQLRLLPVPAAELDSPPVPQDAQHVYRFVPATLPPVDGPDVTTIALPANVGDVTIDSFAVDQTGERSAAASAPAGAPSAEVFLAVRNHTAGSKTGRVLLRRAEGPPTVLPFDLPPAGRAELLAELPPDGDYYWAVIDGAAGPAAAAFAARRVWPPCKLAIIGQDDPMVRHFVQVRPGTRLVAGPAEADAVIAIGADPPAGKPALSIHPPSPPPGWVPAGELSAIALRDAGVLIDNPVMAYVDLAAVSVLRSPAWRQAEPAIPGRQGVALLAYRQKGAEPVALAVALDNPRRVFLAFDTSAENSSFALTQSFVFFLANVVKHLCPSSSAQVEYQFQTPLSAGPRTDWTALPAPAGAASDCFGPPLPPPGLYRDPAGQIHAVNLVGLQSAEPDQPPREKVAALSLPPPLPAAQALELLPLLALAAGLCWLAGWTLRLR